MLIDKHKLPRTTQVLRQRGDQAQLLRLLDDIERFQLHKRRRPSAGVPTYVLRKIHYLGGSPAIVNTVP